MSASDDNGEYQRRLLSEYLLEAVENGISGRDGEDIIDTSPSRAIFAGVLQTVRRQQANPAVTGGRPDATPPADTSLGLDFRVVGPASASKVRLTITPRFSVYYPVFPTYEQALISNRSMLGLREEEPAPTIGPPNDAAPAAEAAVDAPEAAGDVGLSDENEEDEPEPAGPIGRVMLPRVFRRHDIAVEPVVFNVTVGSIENRAIGEEALAAAIARARASILADTRRWKHLAEPKQAERELGDTAILATADAYEGALAQRGKESVEPPLWSASLQVDSGPDPGYPNATRVRVLLANTTDDEYDPQADRLLEERSLFDAEITIEVAGGDLLPFDFLLAPKDYRSNPQMAARGINCTAKWGAEFPTRLQTETLPVFQQPYYRTKAGVEVLFATLDADDPTPELERLATEMDAYLRRWDQFLQNEKPPTWGQAELEACQADREEFRKEVEEYRFGIETLRRDPKLREAFRLMNRAFTKLGKASGGKLRAWRMFQIGFIVSQLPALAVRELTPAASDAYAERLRELLNEVAVLWFPTGGGKTESYLGLIATALLYDRLRGKTRGVCAWMRFPLRMLSLQQLERLGKVVAALNQIRSECPEVAGGDPFAIGYYVGDTVTPNSVDEKRMRDLETSKDAREDLRYLRNCPFCGSPVEIKPLRTTWRVAHVCTNEQCFSNTSDSLGFYKGSLPLCIIDSEIYRFLPSVLVGTVDKLAIVGRNRFFTHIVRGAQQQCPIHGYTSYGECIERGSWGANCQIRGRRLTQVGAVKDPGPSLLIQDELHLLRAELGVFNGHYEGLLRYLGGRAHMRPKVLAATATIEAYDVHTFHIYLARSRRYPQPAWERGESFYATSKPLRYRRFYLGILNHTRAIEDSALRALTLYIRALRRLSSDLRKAAQIMGVPNASDEEVIDTLRLYDLSLCYVNRKATGGSMSDKMPLIERVLDRERLGGIKHRVLTGDQTTEYVGDTLDIIERERNETNESRLNVVIATNLISHGVDLERINMMTVCGMPSHYAEYVQATSRAARLHPGVIFVCFKARDPREHSQFEFFSEMHEHMDRLIEAVAVNRFASFAPQKTVPGLLSGLLLCEHTPALFGTAIKKPLDHIPTLQIALGLKATTTSTQSGCVDPDALRSAIEEIIGVDKVYAPATTAQIDNLRQRVGEAFDDQLGAIGRALEAKLADVVHPITSFRDVDEGIDFGSKDASTIVGRLRAK